MSRTSPELNADLLAALAHPNRLRIVGMLRNGSRCNCELAPALELEQSNLSRHLKILVQAGVLVSWKEGLRVNFRVADNRIFRIVDLASALVRARVTRQAEAVVHA